MPTLNNDSPDGASCFLVEANVGRLICTRLTALQHVHQVAHVELAIVQALQQVASKVVICTDWRDLNVLGPEVADAVVNMLRVTNVRVERGAILLGPLNAVFSLQVERVLRDAKNPGRRSFRRRGDLLAWIAEVLNPAELSGAARFLENIPL